MSYETVFLPKFSPDGTIILAKYQFGHLYTFWTVPILILSPVQIIMRHTLRSIFQDFFDIHPEQSQSYLRVLKKEMIFSYLRRHLGFDSWEGALQFLVTWWWPDNLLSTTFVISGTFSNIKRVLLPNFYYLLSTSTTWRPRELERKQEWNCPWPRAKSFKKL